MVRWLVAVGVLLAVSLGSATAGDWPQYRGPARDAKSTDEGLLSEWPETGPELLWTKVGLGEGYTQAIVADGMVYVTGAIEEEGFVHTFGLDGARKWRASYGPTFPGARRGYAGARSTPTVHGGMLYVAGSGGVLVCLDVKTGGLVWKHPFTGGRRSNHATTPVYADGLLFCSAGYGKGSEILKLAEDGRAVTLMRVLKKPDNRHGNLVLVDGHVYGTGQQNAGQWVCVELATGEIKWEAKGVGKGSVSAADGMLYCYGERDGRVALVRPSTSGFEEVCSFLVTAGSGAHWAHPTIAGGRLYIRHGDALLAYDVKAK